MGTRRLFRTCRSTNASGWACSIHTARAGPNVPIQPRTASSLIPIAADGCGSATVVTKRGVDRAVGLARPKYRLPDSR